MTPKTTQTETASKPQRHEMHGAPDDFLPGGWLIASYLVLAVLFFLPAILPGRMLFGTDHLGSAYFFERFASERLAAGELPKWNPLVFGGVPFFANAMDTYYPVTVLGRLVGLPTHALPLLNFIVGTFLAGTGTYLLLRELRARRMPSYLGGLLFMFSGYILSFIYGGHDGRAIVATLTPFFLFGLHRAIRTGGLRWFVLAGVVLGGANLSNQIQNTYYMLLAGGLWGFFLLWHLDALQPVRRLAGRLGGGLLTLAVGFGMAAINYLPFLGYISASPRGGDGGRGWEYATSWSMPPEEIIGLAVPERIGILDAYWGQNPFKLHTEYVGALAILAVLAGIYLLRKNRYLWYFLGLGILTLTISFGGHTPIYRLYYELLPGTDLFRAPANSFFLLSVSFAVIAGLAVNRLATLRAAAGTDAGEARGSRRTAASARDARDTLRVARYIGMGALAVTFVWGLVVGATAPDPVTATPQTQEAMRAAREAMNHEAYLGGIWRFLLFLALSAGGLWLWVRGTFSTRVAGVLLAIVAVGDLWVVDKRFFDTVPTPDVTFAPDQVADFLRQQPGPFRVFSLDNPQDNYLTRFDLQLTAGEHANPLQRYNEILGAGEETYTDFHNIMRDFRTGDPTFLALTNTRYLVSSRPVQAPFLAPVFRGRSRSGSQATVYENRAVLPRAFLAAEARLVEGRDAALARMRQPDFDPRDEVLLYEEPVEAGADGTESGQPAPAAQAAEPSSAAADPTAAATGSTEAAGSARVTRYDPSSVDVAVQASRPAYLVLTDAYYDGWTASVDGESAPVVQADHAFRAVPVPAGEHTVRLRFEPRAFQAGVSVSGILWTLLAVYGLALAGSAWRRRDPAR